MINYWLVETPTRAKGLLVGGDTNQGGVLEKPTRVARTGQPPGLDAVVGVPTDHFTV